VRRLLFGLVAGMVLALGFSTPTAATAVDPLTFEFIDGCGYIETKVTNNSARRVHYSLATIISGFPTAMGPVDFRLAGRATRTHRWLVRFHHGVRASSSAIPADIDHLYNNADPACNVLWPQPLMIQDCHGKVLATVGAIEQAGLGGLVFAVNGRAGKPFSPTEPHKEIIEGLKIGDVVSFQVPALTKPHELVTWYQTRIQDSPLCGGMPPVTVTYTCTGVNVNTVNTGAEVRALQLVSPVQRDVPLAPGQALNEDLPAIPGASVLIFWEPPGFETGFNPAAVVGIYAQPGGCDGA